jgi:sigma-B regulation protein RsbU (phosphoserine phosphatase)
VAGGNFDAALPEITTKDEMKDLHDSFVHMQKDLKKYIDNLKSTTSAKEKIESELRIAREIQMGMIPKIFPPFPDLIEIDLYAMMEPAKEVGGDLYDFFLIDDRHLCFAIGDVSGKGVPASLFMAITRTLLRTVAPNQHSPREIVGILNRSLSQGNESSMFVTFFIGILNVDTGHLKYVNAGHNPPAIIHAGGKIETFEITKDIPIGLFESFDYEEKDRYLLKDDRIFLYTDGITEAENWDQELFTEERLLQSLSSAKTLEPVEIVMSVARDVVIHVNDYLQSDDLTMMCIIYRDK